MEPLPQSPAPVPKPVLPDGTPFPPASPQQQARRDEVIPAAPPVAKHPADDPVEVVKRLHTWNVFTHLVKWFAIHMTVVLVAIYCLVVQDNLPAGLMFGVASTAILIWGIVSMPKDTPRNYLPH